jgi:hypothetical protein
VPGARDFNQRAVGERHPDRLALPAVDPPVAVAATVEAVRRPAGAAQDAGAVRPRERRDDKIAGAHRPDLGAHLLHHAHELVADRALVVPRLAAVVPEVGPADARERHADDRVGRVLDPGVGSLAHVDVARSIEDGSAHGSGSLTGDDRVSIPSGVKSARWLAIGLEPRARLLGAVNHFNCPRR